MVVSPYSEDEISEFVKSFEGLPVCAKVEKYLRFYYIDLIVRNGKKYMIWNGIKVNIQRDNNCIKFSSVILPEYLRNFDSIKNNLMALCLKMSEIASSRAESVVPIPISIEEGSHYFDRSDKTQETIVPFITPTYMYVHHSKRYDFASKFCEGMVVLDIACGSGYGSKIISKSAKLVVGADYDSDNIRFSKTFYCSKNSEFLTADARYLPFDDSSFDVVVSFETAEHLPKSDISIYIEEIKRVLRKVGIFIISTTNKRYGGGELPEDQRGHHFEMRLNDFRNVLGSFGEVAFYSQRYTENVNQYIFSEDIYDVYDVCKGIDDIESEFFLALCKK